MPAPVASGWSESPGGPCTHWKSAALSRRTPTPAVRDIRRDQLNWVETGRSALLLRLDLPLAHADPAIKAKVGSGINDQQRGEGYFSLPDEFRV